MSNVPPPGGQGGPFPGGPAPAPFRDPYESGPYRPVTRDPLVYFHVMLNGDHVGYLWAGTDDRSAGFLRRGESFEGAVELSVFWSQRLQEASWKKLPSRDAVRQWVGRPDDPVGGGIPADATERTAANYDELRKIQDPDYQPSPGDSILYGELPDGTPLDRSKGWGPLSLQVPATYGLTTDGPVRHLPVVRDDGLVLGYLWAAVQDDAARFLPRDDAAAVGARPRAPGSCASATCTPKASRRSTPSNAAARSPRTPPPDTSVRTRARRNPRASTSFGATRPSTGSRSASPRTRSPATPSSPPAPPWTRRSATRC
ncbi:hypothetical protein BJF79_25490 [Actinomadura sp. CNU-125]|uniref:hypothetical protein n=1 Tax=Actinomadura sp. CNU-125 TaxID=1904961 RepID=UPI000963D8F0|nr:hypothetical protein [Actinomadura sp. CNU-125]OLT10828.1 hypothetical protein BJF79_25490 [Actinomadura sp. CNU-125]